MFKMSLVLALTIPFFAAPSQAASEFGTVTNSSITEQEVRAAQDAWGKALVRISETHDSKGVTQLRRAT